MARGAQAKSEIIEKLLNVFEGSFLYNDGKEIRIPLVENGEEVQIKVTLTCAKENVVQGGDNVLPGAEDTNTQSNSTTYTFSGVSELKNISKPVEPTAEEKANVKSLLSALGL